MSNVEDDSGAIPVDDTQAPADNSGAAPVAQADPQDEPIEAQNQADQGQGAGLQAGYKKIVSYLMGEGAAPQQQVKALAAQVGEGTPDDRNLLAVHKAGEMGGPAAAWAMIQANRQAYNAKQAFAYAALNGVDGKTGDLVAAANAASQAGAHVLDGSSAMFHPSQDGGVTVAVKMPGMTSPTNIKLSREQFNEYLNVGKTGQYDKVLEEGGVPGTLQRVARSQGEPLKAPGGAPGQSSPSMQDLSGANDGNAPMVGGKAGVPEDVEPDETDPKKKRDEEETDAIQKRAYRIFPAASQSAQREQWMEQQENQYKDRQNKVDVANEGFKVKKEIASVQGGARTAAADRTAQGREKVAETQADARRYGADAKGKSEREKSAREMLKIQNSNVVAAERNRASLLRTKLLSGATLTPQEEKDITQMEQRSTTQNVPSAIPQGQTPQAPVPQAHAPQQGGGGPPQPGMKQFNGKWYTREQYQQEFGK